MTAGLCWAQIPLGTAPPTEAQLGHWTSELNGRDPRTSVHHKQMVCCRSSEYQNWLLVMKYQRLKMAECTEANSGPFWDEGIVLLSRWICFFFRKVLCSLEWTTNFFMSYIIHFNIQVQLFIMKLIGTLGTINCSAVLSTRGRSVRLLARPLARYPVWSSGRRTWNKALITTVHKLSYFSILTYFFCLV